MAKMISATMKWLEDRMPIAAARDFARHKTVPLHRYTVFYYLGGMTLFFFLVQVVTGILLMLYYRPSAEEAYESIEFIMTTVPFGWLVRSLHAWSANLMVFFAFIHLVTVFFMKGYRKPREITWISGVILLVLALAFGFSGYLLPWNELAFFATKVGTDIASAVPLVGDWTVRFLRGGERVTGGTLSRFYGWHVAILPAITTVVLGLHLLLVQVQGMSIPSWIRRRREKLTGMPFFPHFALRDLLGWTVALGVLATLAAFAPAHLGEKADPFAPAYAGIKPEWYFMFMFETLKLVPGGEIAGLEYEAFPILFFALCGVVLALVPFLDREKPGEEGVSRVGWFWWILGAVALVYMVGFTAWGYRSWTPVWVMLATGVLIAFLQYATRHRTAR